MAVPSSPVTDQEGATAGWPASCHVPGWPVAGVFSTLWGHTSARQLRTTGCVGCGLPWSDMGCIGWRGGSQGKRFCSNQNQSSNASWLTLGAPAWSPLSHGVFIYEMGRNAQILPRIKQADVSDSLVHGVSPCPLLRREQEW